MRASIIATCLLAFVSTVCVYGAEINAPAKTGVTAPTKPAAAQPGTFNITTTKGQTYKNCRIRRYESDGISITHSGGMSSIPYADIPAELQEPIQKARQKSAAQAALAPPVITTRPQAEPAQEEYVETYQNVSCAACGGRGYTDGRFKRGDGSYAKRPCLSCRSRGYISRLVRTRVYPQRDYETNQYGSPMSDEYNFNAAAPDGGQSTATSDQNTQQPHKIRTWASRTANLKFAYIPAGKFIMGTSTPPPNAHRDESPHTAYIPKGFWLGQFEITQEQWREIMGTTVQEERDRLSSSLPIYGKGPLYPMVHVNWESCQDFAKKLCEIEGVPEGTYRLPTEAEWEYACKAGTSSDYPGGLDKTAWYGSKFGPDTHPVGGKLANPWGLYDMLGNVDEWCSEWVGDSSSDMDSGPAPENFGVVRPTRGGSYQNGSTICRSSYRGGTFSNIRSHSLGFRILREDTLPSASNETKNSPSPDEALPPVAAASQKSISAEEISDLVVTEPFTDLEFFVTRIGRSALIKQDDEKVIFRADSGTFEVCFTKTPPGGIRIESTHFNDTRSSMFFVGVLISNLFTDEEEKRLVSNIDNKIGKDVFVEVGRYLASWHSNGINMVYTIYRKK